MQVTISEGITKAPKGLGKVPRIEHRPWFGDPRLRTPMEVTMGWKPDGSLVIHMVMHPVGRPGAQELQHSVQFHLEKLNMDMSLMAEQAMGIEHPTAPAEGHEEVYGVGEHE